MSRTASVQTLSVTAVTAPAVITAGALFLIPLLVAGPQLLVGTVVNFFLVLSARKYPLRQLAVLAFLPSLGALLHGVIFGPMTPFLVYLLPFIWLGNLALISVFRLQSHTRGLKLVSGAVAKTLLLSVSASLLHAGGFIPVVLVTAMGAVQLFTALGGGVLAILYDRN